MPSPKTRRNSSRAPATAPAKLRTVPNAVAVRYRPGRDKEVRDALGALGEVELHRSQRMAVLERASGITSARVTAALDTLQTNKAIDFVTPVLLDPRSNTRQVLTDEIVLRLKPGRTRSTLKTLGAAHGVKISRRNEFDPANYLLKVAKPSGTQTIEIARSLDASDDVEFASPNFLTELKR